jgi:endogenous inhibitor of DNA gyrase (YacG/DUF329 family)
MSASRKCCPICKTKEPVEQYRPFCSKRCADVDLSKWLGGVYSIPSVEPPDEFELMEAVERAERDRQQAED